MWKHFLLFICLLLSNAKAQDVFDEADDLLQEFEQVVNGILGTADLSMTGIKERINVTGLAVSNIAKRILTQLQQGFVEDISALERRGQDAGVNTISCTYGTKREIAMFTSSQSWEIENCATTRARESLVLVEEPYSIVAYASSLVEEYANTLKECRAGQDTVCAITVMTQIETQKDLLPELLSAAIEEAANMIDSIERYLEDCSVTPTDSVRLRGQTVVNAATQCLNNLLDSEK